uniref:Uncharacterized protein n=1 Tax=Coptotermes formosanus TaxID=36987 RepID=R4V2K0_COPFO|nr:hypothetical protein [Coptotermes formosanus]
MNYIIQTGYTASSQRQIVLRDYRKPEEPISSLDIDSNTAVLVPFVDIDTGVLFLFARGDISVKYYELRNEDPALLYLAASTVPNPLRGFCLAPKVCVDTAACEIDRFYVVLSNNVLSPYKMIVPRRNADSFQEDLYPQTVEPKPTITFDAWNAGGSPSPNLISLENGYQLPDLEGLSFSVSVESEDPAVLKEEIARLKNRVAELEAEVASLKGQ